ncbi:MAG: MFS transporter [Streptosporangiales bacterium]|nr:MFS transporter [Streptosporangiales bacterium]
MSARAGADPQAAPEYYTHKQVVKILVGLLMAMMTAMISTSIVGTALPTIVGELGGQEQYSWVASATLLTMTATTPLWGKISDLYGRKRVFQIALLLFVLASAAAGFSQNIGWLIAARAVQGMGVGGLQALTQIVLGDIVEPRERGRYAGYMGSVFGVSTIAGPLAGGFLVDTDALGWRWCFFVSIPLAVVAFIVIARLLHLPKLHNSDARVDWWGALFITGGATALMLLLSFGGKEFAWNSPWSYVLGIGGVLFFLLAIPAERAAHDPILPPRLFRNRTFVFTGLASLLVGVAMFGAMIYLPQYLQIVKGMSPTASGLMMIPMVASMFVTSVISGQLVTRIGRWKIYPMIGMLFVAAGLYLLSHLHVDSSRWVIGGDVAVLGMGLGLTMQILILAAQNAVSRQDIASSTSAVSFFRSLGGAMGVAAFGSVLTTRLSDEMTELMAKAHIRPPAGGGTPSLGSPEAIRQMPEPMQIIIREAFTSALHTVFLIGAPIALLGFFVTLLMKEVPLRTSRTAGDGAPPAEPRPLTREEALAAGLMLELAVQRVHAADGNADDSPVARAAARISPLAEGSTSQRARAAADHVMRPAAMRFLRHGIGETAPVTERTSTSESKEYR